MFQSTKSQISRTSTGKIVNIDLALYFDSSKNENTKLQGKFKEDCPMNNKNPLLMLLEQKHIINRNIINIVKGRHQSKIH